MDKIAITNEFLKDNVSFEEAARTLEAVNTILDTDSRLLEAVTCNTKGKNNETNLR